MGLHVPGGSVVTASAYCRAADAAGVRDELAALRHRLAVYDPEGLRAASEALTAAAYKIDLPLNLADAVLAAYHDMGTEAAVAVRSSATAEDAGDTSFAGMHTTYTWVHGDHEMLARVRDC